MSAKIITVLGMIGYTKPDYIIENGEIKKVFVEKVEKDKAVYSFASRLQKKYSLKKDRYINTLPLLCELFAAENIIPVYTDKSKEVQRGVLRHEKLAENFLDDKSGYISNDKDFKLIFELINNILRDNEKVIIDITHGFRHLPILATISLIMENIKNINKIEHIFFAKEVVPHLKYEIIDLKEYLDVANISFVLAGFRENYTISHHIKCVDPQYQEIIDLLSQFSEHILANSIIELIDAEDSLANRILQRLETIDKSKTVGLDTYINGIKLHLQTMNAYAKLPKEEQLYKMAMMLSKKGYYLNAVTLLDEAIGFYCASRFKTYSPKIEEHIQKFLKQENNKSTNYELSKSSKTLVKKLNELNGSFLSIVDKVELSKDDKEKEEQKINSLTRRINKIPAFILQMQHDGYYFQLTKTNGVGKGKLSSGEKKRRQKEREKIKQFLPQEIMQEILKEGMVLSLQKKNQSLEMSVKDEIIKSLQSKTELKRFQDFIEETDDLRNNLAHANSSNPLQEIRGKMMELLNTYNTLCMQEDILN